MRWLLNKLFGWLRRSRPRITCESGIWATGIAELNRRTLGERRESGAFLLGTDDGQVKRILEFVYYDDIDPHSLDTGIVHFAGNKLPRLWEHCRTMGYGVVADVHVHPGHHAQSASDQADPVMPREGHFAFIIPDFARRETQPGGIGMYEYLGNRVWSDHSREGSAFFSLEQTR
jgi:hypothetical protein